MSGDSHRRRVAQADELCRGDQTPLAYEEGVVSRMAQTFSE